MKNLNDAILELERRFNSIPLNKERIKFQGFELYVEENDYYGVFLRVDLDIHDFVSAFTIKELRQRLAAKHEQIKKWDRLLRPRIIC